MVAPRESERRLPPLTENRALGVLSLGDVVLRHGRALPRRVGRRHRAQRHITCSVVVLVLEELDRYRLPGLGIVEQDYLGGRQTLGELIALDPAADIVHPLLSDSFECHDASDCHLNLLIELRQPYASGDARGLDELLTHAPLTPEVSAPEPPRLRGRRPSIAERVHDLVGEVPLSGRKARRIVPVQTGADVLMHPRLGARDLVGAPMQLPHLLEQRLEHLVVYRQEGRTLLADECSLLRRSLDPYVEVDALALDDVLAFADLGSGNDPVVQHDVSLVWNLDRELNPRAAVRKVETRVVSSRDQARSSTEVRGA